MAVPAEPEPLRTSGVGELQVSDVRKQVMLSLFTDFENTSVFKPNPGNENDLHEMLDQVVAWSGASKNLRTAQPLSP
jgi:hypothetical protein